MTRTNYTPIQEGSQATPGLWNAIFSALSTDLDVVLSTTTSTFSSSVTVTGGVTLVGPLSVQSGVVRIAANSNSTDYLFLTDSSNQRSNYVLGSKAGNTGDGLNIWDDSGSTMIVSFSKQSVRFYQPVVASSFDQGGAVFNLLAYGATSDDSTDAAPSLRSLLAAMPPSGGDILISGQFALASTVTIQQSIRFLGTGIGSKWRRGVNSDITGSGSQLRYTATSGDMLVVVASATTPQIHFGMENLTLVGNARIPGSTRGVVLHFLAPSTTLAVNPLLVGVQVQESSGDGIAFDGNVFEGGLIGCVISQCSQSGISTQANGGGAPSELAFVRVTTSLNSTNISLSGGDNLTFLQLTATSATNAGLVVNGTKLAGSDLHMESNGSVYFRGLGLQRTSIHGIHINYSAGASNATGFFLDGNCVNNLFSGVVTNADASNTDFVLAPGAQSTTILAYHANDFTQHINDQGFLTQTLAGSQFSRPILTLDGTSGQTVAFGFFSERSLGWFRSGASAMGLSYGQLRIPDGTALLPGYAHSSESSLGWFRSANSTLALSYGTLSLPSNLSFSGGAGIIRVPNQEAIRMATNSGTLFADTGTLQVREGDGGTATGGRLVVNAGSAALPTMAFENELTLGWFRSALGVMSLSTGGIGIKAGTNASCGTAVLGSNGSVNVATNYVKTGDLIFLTDQTPGGTLGDLEILGIRNGSGFTIASTGLTDTSTVAWLIVRPG